MEHVSGKQSSEKDRTQPEMNWSGRRFGDFQVIRSLGQGGMGQVYLAEQISLKRKVALKLLRPDLAANKTAFARFKAEAHAVAQATHANIVQVYALGEENGAHYMALEYVDGRNLRQYLEKKGPPELMLALSIIRQVAAALQRASEIGIVHRDIKPENILLSRKGEVKVADFGLSRFFGDEHQPLNLTQSGMTMGTPLYMSPEQVEGKKVDPRTDIYSFGVTIYHLLAGEPPFRGTTAFEVAVQHVQAQPRHLSEIRSDLPASLCNLVHRMMAKRAEDRIQTCREIIREVVKLRDSMIGAATLKAPLQGDDAESVAELYMSGQVVQAGPGPANPSYDAALTQSLPTAKPRRRWIAVVVLLSILVAAATGIGVGFWQGRGSTAVNSQSDPPPSKSEAVETVLAAAPMTEQEKQLLGHLQTASGDELQRYRLDLAVYYLKVHRLDEAEKQFKQLDDPTITKGGFRQYSFLGRAMVLAFQDKTKASNELFLKVFKGLKGTGKEGSPLPPLLQKRADMAEWTARALQYNYTNSPATFPAILLPYRSPPPPRLKSGD